MQKTTNGESPEPCNSDTKLHLENSNSTMAAQPIQPEQKNIPRYQRNQWQILSNRYGRHHYFDSWRNGFRDSHGINSRQSRCSHPNRSWHDMQTGEVKTLHRNWDSWDAVESWSDSHKGQVVHDSGASSRHGCWNKTEAPMRAVTQDGWSGACARTSWHRRGRETPRMGVARDGWADTCAITSWNDHWRGSQRRGLKRGDRNFGRVCCDWDTKWDDWGEDTSPSEKKRPRAFISEKNGYNCWTKGGPMDGAEYDLVREGETREQSSCGWSPWPCQKPSTSPWDILSGKVQEAT